jgi:hypothetical protein
MAIKSSETMQALTVGMQEKTNNTAKTLILMSGPVPTKEMFEKALPDLEVEEGRIGGEKLATWTSSRNNFPMAEAKYPSSLKLSFLGPRDFKFSISRQYEIMSVLSSGEPTWFMFISWYNASQRVWGTSFLDNLIIGTIGDENSSADMKIKGGLISVGVPLKANDIEFRVN